MTPTDSNSHTLTPDDWSGSQGERWLANLDRLESMIEPIGDALIARAGLAPGERVLDIGCGGGATTRAIATLVGPEGEALGIDVAPMLVAEAERRAAAHGIANARFLCADAASVTLEDAPFDRLVSRFGSMFFDEPVAAFANLHALLKPGARIDLAVWGPPRDNAWMMELMGVVRRHVEVPPAQPRAPGPFAFEDLDYLREVLDAGGFGAMEVDAYEGRQAIGGPGASPQEAVAFVLGSLGVGRILAEQPDAVRDAASADLLALFEGHHVAGEGVLLGCRAWLVSARAGG
jgi:SAM-dependent methyltransferase